MKIKLSFYTTRSSRQQMPFKIGVLKNFTNFIRKNLLLESLINEVAGLIKKRRRHRGIFLRNLPHF